VNWQDAGKFVGQEVTVQGRIVQACNIGAAFSISTRPGRSPQLWAS
jgi:hypothetical protein